MNARRLAVLSVALIGALISTACVFAPPSSYQKDVSGDVAKMSEKAIATCGAGNVREVNSKSFTCK
ncbi:hypothetical protein [Roseateles sp.]|uniref:hypothetical protein n=1 Tax=Roseateles sp. TaxID=1971397 RepID=UPI00392AEB48